MFSLLIYFELSLLTVKIRHKPFGFICFQEGEEGQLDDVFFLEIVQARSTKHLKRRMVIRMLMKLSKRWGWEGGNEAGGPVKRVTLAKKTSISLFVVHFIKAPPTASDTPEGAADRLKSKRTITAIGDWSDRPACRRFAWRVPLTNG